jgi:hypothetical protein
VATKYASVMAAKASGAAPGAEAISALGPNAVHRPRMLK